MNNAAVKKSVSVKDTIALYNKEWHRPKFWRDMFLYYWIFSLIGHIIEIIWALFGELIGLRITPTFDTIPVFAVAAPYGLGAVVLLIFIYPLVKQKKLGIVGAYFMSVFITTLIEFVCAALIVLFVGHNSFWDYSDRFMNLFGFVCLGNSLLFGVISIFSLWVLFPWTEKLRHKVSEFYLNLAFWILFVGYILVQVARLFFRF